MGYLYLFATLPVYARMGTGVCLEHCTFCRPQHTAKERPGRQRMKVIPDAYIVARGTAAGATARRVPGSPRLHCRKDWNDGGSLTPGWRLTSLSASAGRFPRSETTGKVILGPSKRTRGHLPPIRGPGLGA